MNCSAGVAYSSVFLKRSLRLAATQSRSSWLTAAKDMALGKYWRSRPLVFSFEPRSHVLCPLPAAAARFSIGGAPWSEPSSSSVAQAVCQVFRYYPRRLANALLQTETAI